MIKIGVFIYMIEEMVNKIFNRIKSVYVSFLRRILRMIKERGVNMVKGSRGIIVIIFLAVLLWGAIMSEGKEKPPILGQEPQGVAAASPPVMGFPPPIGGVAPPPPAGGPVPPPPPGGGPVPPPPGGVQPPSLAGGWTIPDNALKAVEIAKEVKKYILPGKIWMMRGPAGDMEIKAALVYQGVALDVLRFNPINGELLACGFNPKAYSCTVSLDAVRSRLPTIMAGLVVLEGAEYREPEACWAVPLACGGKIVAHIKVYYDGIHVVPDYPATQEMNYYGR